MSTKKVTDLSAALSEKPIFNKFGIWLVGDTPLIVHAWSEKAKKDMLKKQVTATRAGRAQRDPEQDFNDSMYKMGDDVYGFPVTGFKKAMISVAHKDKGIPQTVVRSSLWVEGEMTRTMPALAGAICDVPLIRIWGSEPEMREDMVRIGTGLRKTSNLAYRAQFTHWAVYLTGQYNSAVLSDVNLLTLATEAGLSCGIGEWRNEKDGVFGAFHPALTEERKAWDKFASGKGPLPVSDNYLLEAAE